MPDISDTKRVPSPWGDLEFTPVEDADRAPSLERGDGRPQRRADGRPRASRAAQFMPFAALTGYYDLVREQERIVEPRHELTEEEADELSRTIMQVRRGDLVRITYYDRGGYKTRAGVVNAIEPERRRLRLGTDTIPFDDIWKLLRA
ncbi:YolD-like family protein [Collinsella tanakaei]|nr:YolD-like family protein [Collinsella tanakaei]